jgi:DNA-binding response OmpR family regulator
MLRLTYPMTLRYEAEWRGKIVRLRPGPYRLLELMAIRRGCIVSTEDMLDYLYDDNEPLCSSNVAWNYISYLRKVLPGIPITTHPTRGWLLER